MHSKVGQRLGSCHVKERPLDHRNVYELPALRRGAGSDKENIELGCFIVVVGEACGDHGLSPFMSRYVWWTTIMSAKPRNGYSVNCE